MIILAQFNDIDDVLDYFRGRIEGFFEPLIEKVKEPVLWLADNLPWLVPVLQWSGMALGIAYLVWSFLDVITRQRLLVPGMDRWPRIYVIGKDPSRRAYVVVISSYLEIGRFRIWSRVVNMAKAPLPIVFFLWIISLIELDGIQSLFPPNATAWLFWFLVCVMLLNKTPMERWLGWLLLHQTTRIYFTPERIVIFRGFPIPSIYSWNPSGLLSPSRIPFRMEAQVFGNGRITLGLEHDGIQNEIHIAHPFYAKSTARIGNALNAMGRFMYRDAAQVENDKHRDAFQV